MHNKAILKRLANIYPGARVLKVNTPMAWLIYIEQSPTHCYYINIDKNQGII